MNVKKSIEQGSDGEIHLSLVLIILQIFTKMRIITIDIFQRRVISY